MDSEIDLSLFQHQEEVREGRDYLLKVVSLKNQKEFELASKNQVSFTSRNIKIVSSTSLSPTPSNDNSIFLGFKITKKIGNAVTRNKIRRRIKAIIANIAKSDKQYLTNRQSFIIIPKKSIAQSNFQSIEEEMKLGIKFISRNMHKAQKA